MPRNLATHKGEKIRARRHHRESELQEKNSAGSWQRDAEFGTVSEHMETNSRIRWWSNRRHNIAINGISTKRRGCSEHSTLATPERELRGPPAMSAIS